ncbi:hypothetical protein EV361DRAFT_894874 [Lentinula raphanica]|nr:hypothetical protein EV361DRAFT_894874 [Lentinula raphanica]
MFSANLRVVPRRLSIAALNSLKLSRIARHELLYSRTPSFRSMSTPPPQLNVSSLSMERYHQLADDAMDGLLEDLEQLIEDYGDASYEVDYHSGVLTLRLGDKGTYVINKQPPNKQIWLSSPFSGPKRYDYIETDGSWRYSRDNQPLDNLLNEELGRAFNKSILLSLSSSRS